LSAVYDKDFSRSESSRGYPILKVKVRPPDLEPDSIGCLVTISLQLGEQYPYAHPLVLFQNVVGLSENEQDELKEVVDAKVDDLRKDGIPMVVELVQITEDFLLNHNKDPKIQKMSAWELMKARETVMIEEQREERIKEERDLNRWLDDSGNVAVTEILL